MRAGVRRLVLGAALVVAAGGVARAAEPGEDLTIRVLTFGPGDHPFFKFGHNAIWVQPREGTGLVYNFGTFTFDSPDLITKFLGGRLTYWLSVTPADKALKVYSESNRRIEAQELDLTPAERAALVGRLQVNARPENRDYLYDYFWDNCSTRVRDAVDGIVAGQVRRAGAAAGGQTLRDHALRMTADLAWEYVALHFLLGSFTDEPLDRWRESFLPDELRDLLREVQLPAGAGAPARPLVKSEQVLFAASRPPKPARAPSWTPGFAAAGLALGGVLAGLGARARTRPRARVALGITSAVVGLVAGLLGTILVLLWAFTNHKAAHANANILQFAPWTLALAVLGIGVALGGRRAARAAFLVAAAAAALSAVGVVAKLWPGVSQDNFAFITFCLPVWTAMAWGLRRLIGR